MKILIRFKDNDYGQLALAFGNLLLRKVQNGSSELTPAHIARWFHNCIGPLYDVLYDPPHMRVGVTLDWLFLQEHLCVSAADVYIGDDVEKKMETAHEWADSDAVMVDGSPHAGTYAVYLV